jgi:predicted unusual protein kinase regulating ubiquinone biosynthesis (AarF/ABC1/UbiB family)
MNNLFTFREMFKYSKIVKFPLPISESTEDSVLVESFVEGVPVTYFKTNRHPLN